MNEVSRGQHPFACSPLCHDGRLTHAEGGVARSLYPDLPFFSCDTDKGVFLTAKKIIPESLESCFCILLTVTQTTVPGLPHPQLSLFSSVSILKSPARRTLASPPTLDTPQPCFWTSGLSSSILPLKWGSRFWLQVEELLKHQPGQRSENVTIWVHPKWVETKPMTN